MRRLVYCTASFSVCSRRRTNFQIIYPDLRLDYKVATQPLCRSALAASSSRARESGSALPGAGKPARSSLLLLELGPSRAEQRDHKTEREKLATALDIFTELSMPHAREDGADRRAVLAA